jgi:hypothetical protein
MKKTVVFLGSLVCSLHVVAQTANCQNVDERLNGLASADQQIRQEWHTLEQNANATKVDIDALQQRWRAVDSDNLNQQKEIIGACGWPTQKKGSHSAWLLTQHADSDIAFQRQARNLMEASVKAGIAAPQDLAYLADRIAANESRPQEYGTQFEQTDRCTLKMLPVDDIELVKRRRLAIGLPSLEAYQAEGRRRLIPADCQKEADRGKN